MAPKRLPPHRHGMYAGMGRATASAEMEMICKVAASSGQTVLAAEHLSELADIVMRFDGGES